MKKVSIFIILFVSIFFISVPLHIDAKQKAKEPNEAIGKTGKSTSLVESTYYSLGDLTAKFTQTTKIELVNKSVTKKGVFRFKKGGKFRIEYESPEKKNYISDGTTLWIYAPGDEASLQTFTVSDETVPKEALSFMTGFGKLKKEFSISASNAFGDTKAGYLALHLVPRGKNKHYESLDALFNPDNLVCELIVKNTSGNVSHYVFSDIKTNSNLGDQVFSLPQN